MQKEEGFDVQKSGIWYYLLVQESEEPGSFLMTLYDQRQKEVAAGKVDNIRNKREAAIVWCRENGFILFG